MMTTLKIVSKYNENGGEWFCKPEDKAKLTYVQKTLKEMQSEEPKSGWKLQARGEATGMWHDWGQA